jgi:histidine ammonia-lyase
MTIQLDGPGVTIADVVAVARQGERVELTPAALVRDGNRPGNGRTSR